MMLMLMMMMMMMRRMMMRMMMMVNTGSFMMVNSKSRFLPQGDGSGPSDGV